MKTLKIAIRIILILFLLFVINGLDCRMKVRHYQIDGAVVAAIGCSSTSMNI